MRQFLTRSLVALAAVAATSPASFAITWCHDYTYWEASGRRTDENKLGPRTDPKDAQRRQGLREKLTTLGFQLIDTLQPGADNPDARVKPGDVLILGEAHSGWVRSDGKVDHLTQTAGRTGTVMTPDEARRSENFHNGWTVQQMWQGVYRIRIPSAVRGEPDPIVERASYRGEALEIWRRVGDVRITLTWNTATDVDLHVHEPNNHHCFYRNMMTGNGGHLFQDVTSGHGPEEYQLTKAPAGEYVIKAHMYRKPADVRTPTEVVITIRRNAGRSNETQETIRVILNNHGEMKEVKRFTL